MSENLFKRPTFFIPLGRGVSNGDYLGKLHLSDVTKLHISRFIEYLNSSEDLKMIPPEKTVFLSSFLPQGDEAICYVRELLDCEIHFKLCDVLAFDFWEGRSQNKLITQKAKGFAHLLSQMSVRYELIILIGDNTFPLIMDKVGAELNFKIRFLEFSRKGRLLYPIIPIIYDDNTARTTRKMQEKYIGQTLLAGHQYYTKNTHTVVTIRDDDEYAGGTIFVGTTNESDEEIFWLKNGKNPYTPDLDIVGKKS